MVEEAVSEIEWTTATIEEVHNECSGVRVRGCRVDTWIDAVDAVEDFEVNDRAHARLVFWVDHPVAKVTGDALEVDAFEC